MSIYTLRQSRVLNRDTRSVTYDLLRIPFRQYFANERKKLRRKEFKPYMVGRTLCVFGDSALHPKDYSKAY